MLKTVCLTKHYGTEPLFDGVDLLLGPGDRVGLVGPNGAGKSTLLRVLAGAEPPSSGRVERSPGTRVGYYAQQVPDPAVTVGAFLRAGLGEMHRLDERMRALQAELAAGRDVLREYGEVQERWTALRGWATGQRLAEVRQRLDVAHLPDGAAVAEVSGGERARLMLARVLLADPDVLVLDEPTNHLDGTGAAWLGDYLAGFDGAVLVVSHDRAFLDRTVNRVVELDGIHGELQVYPGGGYTAYRAEKQHRWQRLLLDYEAQEKRRRRWELDIARTKEQARGTELGTRNDRLRRYAKKVARKAKARERRLARALESARWVRQPQTRPPLVLAFAEPAELPADRPVLTARGLTVKLAGRTVLAEVDLDVGRGDRILLGGPNGAGKTTLLRVLAGELAADGGEVRRAGEVGLLPQTHDTLRTAASVLEFFRARVPVYADEAEALLAGHLFGPDQWAVPVRTLSAGELRRLLLAVLVNSPLQVLVLDEPTNYLDFDSLDVLEEALRAFGGTLLVVTHDRFLAGRIGLTRRLELDRGCLVTGPG